MALWPSLLPETFSVLVFGFVVLNCFGVDKFGSHPLLPLDEVQILQTISNKLNIRNWTTINQTSCGSPQWNQASSDDKTQSIVTCNCTFEKGSVCHVTNIRVKRYNLNGVLPEELGDLPHLLEIDLTRNYINGTIPPRLAQLPNLKILSLIVNRLTGPIPPEIGNITTLEELVLEDNLLGGHLPPDLGNLTSLKRLLLSANNFSGTIPDTFGNLKNLNDFRIDGSELSGKIPDFIGNWTNITTLDLQGTSMEGPIPSTISLLKKLTTLRISDLKGSSSTFPDLKDMTKMEKLILRNCSMTGKILQSLGNMADLKTLDLSFNKLTDQIPGPLQSLKNMSFMFLNNNLLTGEVPAWILESKEALDLSYNNFTGSVQSTQSNCRQLPVNLVASHVSTGINNISWCLNKDLVCPIKPPQYHSLFINCGGRRETVGDNEYEDDATSGGAAKFESSSERWGYSSTGTHIGTENGAYIATNSYGLNVTGEGFYQTARLAPQSLKYYGLCMLAGSYKVQLHFAEIMYSNSQTFSSLGRRIFDISIQGKVVETNFNIMEEAGGVGIGITKVYDGIIVNGSTLEIHLYWSGKGTTAVPDRGVYGPLISAITVTPNFKVDNGGGLSVGAIIGIVAASCVLAALILLVLRKKGYLGGKDLEDKELRALDLQTGYFSLRQIKHATNNFDPANKIGEGGFGPVYKVFFNVPVYYLVRLCADKAYVLQEQGNLLELVDPSLGSNYSKIEALRMLNLALLCTNPSPTLRPSMSSAVKMHEGQIPVQAPIVKRSTMNQDARFKAFELLSHDSQTHVSNGSQSSRIQKSISMDGPWMDSEFSIESKDEIIEYSSSTKLLKDLYDIAFCLEALFHDPKEHLNKNLSSITYSKPAGQATPPPPSAFVFLLLPWKPKTSSFSSLHPHAHRTHSTTVLHPSRSLSAPSRRRSSQPSTTPSSPLQTGQRTAAPTGPAPTATDDQAATPSSSNAVRTRSRGEEETQRPPRHNQQIQHHRGHTLAT
uniref:non-specific serine/threonine protein kinase n=1 Tax=Populus alba TaxID=43335 RepID=A0A4U5Q1W1_POPAL|nr:putative LRR receptor-like serine/threonine-protein kinase [Populus alba]